MRYFSIKSRKIFEVNEYYDMFFYLFNNLLSNLKMKFNETTFLLLKYSLHDLKNLFMISNCLYHLFSCPRNVFARNDCVYCSQIIIKEINQPKNFICINNFNFNVFLNKFVKGNLSTNSINVLTRFKIIVFFKSLDEFTSTKLQQKVFYVF